MSIELVNVSKAFGETAGAARPLRSGLHREKPFV